MSEELTIENLLARGLRFFQRRVRDVCDPRRTLYFINQFYYEHAELPPVWETEAQMERDGASINIKVFGNADLDKAERIIASVFGLGMKAYDDD
jgi:hypothetical protein